MSQSCRYLEKGGSPGRGEKSLEGPSGTSMPGVFKKQQGGQCGLEWNNEKEWTCGFYSE